MTVERVHATGSRAHGTHKTATVDTLIYDSDYTRPTRYTILIKSEAAQATIYGGAMAATSTSLDPA
jgi:hypothetical protein